MYDNGEKQIDTTIKQVDQMVGEPKTATDSGLTQLLVTRDATRIISEGGQPARKIATKAYQYAQRVRAKFQRNK